MLRRILLQHGKSLGGLQRVITVPVPLYQKLIQGPGLGRLPLFFQSSKKIDCRGHMRRVGIFLDVVQQGLVSILLLAGEVSDPRKPPACL